METSRVKGENMKLGNVLIIGDSYSTFEGYIDEGCAPYYGRSERKLESDVSAVEETWWYRLIAENDANLILNCSYSGTTICHTGYENNDYKEISFAGRLEKLIKDGFFEKNEINTVFVFGGTNDYWAGAPLGEIQYSGWETENLYKVFPATCYLFNKLKEVAPNAKIVKIINDGLGAEITAGLTCAAEHYGAVVVILENIDKVGGHPTVKGMKQITEQISAVLNEKF